MVIKTLIISASSDIGFEFLKDRSCNGESVIATYRDYSSKEKLSKFCDQIIHLDLFDRKSISKFILYIQDNNISWEKILFCPCQPFPYKSFFDSSYEEWLESFNLNSLYQLELLHRLYNYRAELSKVLFFAGGGSNSAVANFSAYTSAKIHLTKMVELLDHENEDMIFSIIGPGWVKTKNHLLALKHSSEDSDKYKETKQFLDSPQGDTPIQDVVESINWLFAKDKEIVGGRNFSTAYDPWGDDNPMSQDLMNRLCSDKNMYKLRRSGNNIYPNKRYK